MAQQKLYVYSALAILLIFILITILVKRNEKIQRNLNKQLIAKTEDLEESQAYLKEVNKTKVRLFSIIGHDLRGPIGAVQGLLDLLQEDEMTTTEFLAFLPKLRKDINNISFTLNNLLSWGNTQMNGATTKPSSMDLSAIAEENIALLSEIAAAKEITLTNGIPSGSYSWSDADQIDIVIRNLVSNALKFTPEGGAISLNAQERAATWEIAIKDNGVGMDNLTMSKIFTESTHSTYGTNDEKGTGLGLSLCKEMVEKNQGSIWVESTLGRGSIFYFSLPKCMEERKRSA